MCGSEHEECGEARGAQSGGSQSRRAGAIGMPWIVSPTCTVKLFISSSLEAAKLLASDHVDTFRVTHLCCELQIRADEHRPQRPPENVSAVVAFRTVYPPHKADTAWTKF
jgi:hypothetical protein